MAVRFPLYVTGKVVRGFGRGAKELGCPTANFSQDAVENLPEGLEPGVYYGWAVVNGGQVRKMVSNIGWCPHYGNEKKSLETHILHKYDEDFYGSKIRICILGYLRPEKKFTSLDELISAIQTDIKNASDALDTDYCSKYISDDYFKNS